MSSLFDSLSEELFQILKGSGKTLTLFGEDGNKTYEPKKARRVFATPDNIMASVIEAGSDSEVKLYLSASTDVREMSKLINTLRQITTRYNVLFNVRKYGRELQPKDFAFQASMMEAAMWGTTKTSYQKFGPTKLIVRHCRPVREGVIGARGRNILGMFVETCEGERFKFAENHLSAGRAFAQHISQGGKPHDEVGTQLAILAQESLALARVNRYILHARNVLGEEAIALRTPIKNRIVELRRAFVGMSRPRGYHKIKEAGLPAISSNLCEATSNRIGELQQLLQIDSNHALAESLMPVALLQMGENMTDMNSMFRGVLTLEDAAADALVEALLDEYGHEGDTWTRFGSNIAFAEEAVFEDATSFLDLVESSYMINENDAILDYATQWTNHRFQATGDTTFADPKDRKEHDKGIAELADGLRAILGNQIEMPAYPYENEPQFRDESAAIRFFLDLFVSQNKLGNIATANYVSTIIDKMAEGKKLDGAEKTIAKKLYGALEDHVDANRPEGEMDESYYADFPYDDRDDAKYEQALETIKDQFDVEEFVADIYPYVMDGDEKDEPLEKAYVMANLDGHIAIAMDHMDLRAEKGQFMNQAEDLFPEVMKFCQERGYTFDTTVQEFVEFEEKPGHHGVAAGDHVATDKGPGVVISVEGDMAAIEFLHGGTETMHVDDMDKLPAFNKFGEEAELEEWFNGFDPESVLEVNGFEHGVLAPKKAAPTNPNFNPEIQVGDRVTHKAYGAGQVVAVDDKMAKVAFDNAHVRLPDSKTVTMSKAVLTKAGAYRAESEEQLDELSPAKYNDYFARAATDRARQEKKADHGDEKAALRLRSRDKGLSTAFKKMRGVAEAYADEDVIEIIFDELHVMANDMIQMPEKFGLVEPNWQDDADEEANNFMVQVAGLLADKLKEKLMSLSLQPMEEAEEVIGGDQGQDLIDDTKVQHGEEDVDEAFRAELAQLMKNARFRM